MPFQIKVTVAKLRLLTWESIDHEGERENFSVVEHVKHKWKQIGDILQVKRSELDSLERRYGGDAGECLVNVFDQWIRNPQQQNNDPNSYSPTWGGLIDLLEGIEESEAANKIARALRLTKADII